MPPHLPADVGDRPAVEVAKLLTDVVAQAIRDHTGTEALVVDLKDESQPARAPLDLRAALTAARSNQCDAVCVVSVGAVEGIFQIWLDLGVPPIRWSTHTDVAYFLRLVDVSSEEVLLEALRVRRTGGLFAVRRTTDLPAELAADLEHLLAAEAAPQAIASASTSPRAAQRVVAARSPAGSD